MTLGIYFSPITKQISLSEEYKEHIITCIIIISLTACMFLSQAYQDSQKSHGTHFEDTIEIIE